MRAFALITGLLLLIALEIFRVYFIMPFPGSQHADTIGIAYFLDRNILWLRLLALALTLPGLIHVFRRGRKWQQIMLSMVVALYAFIFYMFNFKFLADKMFLQPQDKQFAAATSLTDSTRDGLIVGVTIGGESKAYPIQVIGYHHQVRDSIGGRPVMVTYCTVCRTGRVYSPVVNGHLENFRLVGMDHFNAMFEDATTHSWWQQATGIAIAGPLKGQHLEEIPSAQMRLADWQALHEGSLTMQPDPHFLVKYDSLRGYDQGTLRSSLEKRDTGSWQFKSWVVGITRNGASKAYDWNLLVRRRFIFDSAGPGGTRILLTMAPISSTDNARHPGSQGNATYYAFSIPDTLRFTYDAATAQLQDPGTGSHWRADGLCLEGPLKGQTLVPIQSYQEFWHSWRSFHPGTSGGSQPPSASL